MEIRRTEDQYTAHVYGGRFKVTYADEIWQSAQATVIDENGAPCYYSDLAYRVDAYYATQELPYDFTFTITVPPDLCVIVNFGEDLAGVLHYAYPDGTQSDFTYTKDTGAFMEADFQSDRFEASGSLTYSDGPVEWQDEWLSIRDIRAFPKAPTAFETVRKPDCHVRYYNDRFSVHITGGLLQIQYASDIWLTVQDWSNDSNSYAGTTRFTMATAEIPFDFTFTLPMPEIEDDN